MFTITDILSSELVVHSGTVAVVEDEGGLLVTLPFAEAPLVASFLRTTQGALPRLYPGDEVLVAVDAVRHRGYVLGRVEPYALPAETLEQDTVRTTSDAVEIDLSRNTKNVRVKGKKIYIEAGEELRLQCGGGTIQIDRHGTIVVRGNDIISRARGVNKIKGAGVAIN